MVIGKGNHGRGLAGQVMITEGMTIEEMIIEGMIIEEMTFGGMLGESLCRILRTCGVDRDCPAQCSEKPCGHRNR